jgi:hypothetical protein
MKDLMASPVKAGALGRGTQLVDFPVDLPNLFRRRPPAKFPKQHGQ